MSYAEEGFKTINNHWYKTLEDGVLIIKLENDNWGSNALGSSFALNVCFGEIDTPKNRIPAQFNKQKARKNCFYSTGLLPYKGCIDQHVSGAIFYSFYSDDDQNYPSPSYEEQSVDLQLHLNHDHLKEI